MLRFTNTKENGREVLIVRWLLEHSRYGKGRRAVITSPEKAVLGLTGKAGTAIRE